MNSAFLYLVTVMIWGSTFFAVEFQLGLVAPEVSLVYRFVAASLILFGWCACRGRQLRFSVRDNGIGLEPEDRDKIFELFRQVESSKPGTGLGLALVQRIVEVHGGRIWVESDGPGKGCTFHCAFPKYGAP